jgi:uncharacterized protein
MLQLPHRTAQTLAALAASLLLLGGCAPGLLDRGAAEYEMHAASARQYQSAGDWATAAEAWMRAAEAARGDARDLPLVAAAEAWFRAGDLERARSALTGMSASPGAELAARRTLIEARLLLRADRAGEALARLAGVPMGPGDPSATDLLAARADAAFAARQPAVGVAALVRREALLEDAAQRSANQRRTWRRLQEAAAAGLPLETPAGADPLVAAWLELGRETAAAAGNPFRLRAALTAWREQNPEHPAALELVGTLLQEYRAMTEFPQRVALLLPLGGRHAGAAGVVRDGFIAAYLAQGDEGERPALRFYDTTALGATAAYDLAARDGADFIVGPLLKEDLAELAGAELPAVPALALNWVDEGYGLPGYIFQFALAPEEEAASAARRAIRDGHRRALALAHDTEQGRRMAESFVAAFQAEGGEVVGWQVFETRAADFSVEITSLLLLNESRARYQRLQGLLGRNLEYVPRRRQDVDFIFLAARPSEALLIRPQLRFHYAGKLPIYATSSIYDPARSDNAELDGVLFADMPWRVGAGDAEFMARFRSFGPNALDRNGRLYAFGADAYRLVPLLHNRSEILDAGVPGATGILRVGTDSRVHRELEWGRFQGGQVKHAPARVLAEEQAAPPES